MPSISTAHTRCDDACTPVPDVDDDDEMDDDDDDVSEGACRSWVARDASRDESESESDDDGGLVGRVLWARSARERADGARELAVGDVYVV